MRSSRSYSVASADASGSAAGDSHGRPSIFASGSAALPRGSRVRGMKGSRAKDEAHRRAQDLKQEIETAVHVLDNGVNRTPMPLQRRHSLMGGVRGGANGKRESNAGELGSSVFQSSFLMSCDGNSGFKFSGGAAGGVGGGLSMYLQSGSSAGGQRKESSSMESSMQSLSMAGDSVSQLHFNLRGRGGSSEGSVGVSDGNPRRGPHRHSSGVDLSALVDQSGLLHGATYVREKPMTEVERRAWLRAHSAITLTETPTIFLFERQDEAVSNENPSLVAEVKERNEVYAELVEAHRVDEGTRFQERGTATFAVAKKSIHSEVHPPEKVDAGALQVSPWMLKDEFAPLMGGADDDGDDNDDEKQGNRGADVSDGGNGEDADDAGLGDDMTDSAAQSNTSVSGRNESASADPSARHGSTAGRSSGSGGVPQWMLSDSLMSNLRIMERAVVQNMMEKTQLAYRGIHMGPECGRLGMKNAPPVEVPPTQKSRPAEADDNAESGAQTANDGGGEAAAVAVASSPTSFPESDLPEMSASDNIKALWRYHSQMTHGRSATCMAWNRKETDILAVGYSPRRAGSGSGALLDGNKAADPSSDAKKAAEVKPGDKDTTYQRGMICCWSLKNPLAPELVLHLQADAGVSSLAFSLEHPSLLAVGDTEGGIVVYDIQKDLAIPSIVPAVSSGLHTGAVWALKWITSGKERGEFLMSISADGRVVQWVIGKTVERVAPDLMHLKRQPGAQVESAFVEGVAAAEEAAANAAANASGRRGKRGGVGHSSHRGGGGAAASKEDAVLSRQAGGMCFDVCPADHAIYVVGTEDGAVYQCNKSQTESYDLDYTAHAELVYRVRWSPYSSKYFLTCSADWTTRLYALGHAQVLMQFDSPNQDAVQDVAWSHSNALYFATATAQGNVELWCVGDAIYPRATVRYADHRRLNCLLFAEQEMPVIVAGDDEGDVVVFLLKDSVYGRQDLTDDEQEAWLEEAVKKSA